MAKGKNDSEDRLIALDEPISVVSDRYRMLFAKTDSLCRKQDKKVVAFTSAIKGEGKTTTTANMAVVGARDFGKRCLLIDGDFRNPTLAKRFGITDGLGLANVVLDGSRLGDLIRRGPVSNLAILPMGRPQASPSGAEEKKEDKEVNIWASERIRGVLTEVRGWFDYVFVDAPPILPLCDMNLISESVDGIVVVVRSGTIPEQLLLQAVKSLDSSKIIGTVLNRAEVAWPSRYYQYGY
jgi:capsular exopolysaccharide synthesis family protein